MRIRHWSNCSLTVLLLFIKGCRIIRYSEVFLNNFLYLLPMFKEELVNVRTKFANYDYWANNLYFNYKNVIEYSNISNAEKLVDRLIIKVGMLKTSLTLKFVRNLNSTS